MISTDNVVALAPERICFFLTESTPSTNHSATTSINKWLANLPHESSPEIVLAASVTQEWMSKTPYSGLKGMRQVENHQRQFAERQKALELAKEQIQNIHPKLKISTHILSGNEDKIALQVLQQHQCQKLFLIKFNERELDFEILSSSMEA